MVQVKIQRILLIFTAFLLLSCGQSGSNTTGTKNTVPIVLGSCGNGPASLAGQIFLENPRVSSGNPNLSFSAPLDSYASAATVSGLDTSCLLQSSNFRIFFDSLYESQVATTSVGGSLAFPVADPRFQQVNAFYYANQIKRRLDTLGISLASLGMVTIDAHCDVNENAYYSPSSKLLCLGYTNYNNKKVWAADDADVVIHETGHALNHTLVGSNALYSSGEAGAMDEAYADYWARTSHNNSKIGEWFLGAIEAALNITGIVRDSSQTNLYPDSMVYEVHDDSRTFGEALWKIRQSIGTSAADSLIAQSLRILPATARFAQGVRALQDAAVILGFSQTQRSAIDTVLSNQGLIRQDTATSLQWPPTNGSVSTWVIDDHTFSSQAGGNCNAALDAGETAMVFFNLQNTSAQKGVVALELSNASSGASIVSGWNVGEYFRFNANRDFLFTLRSGGVIRDEATVAAAFMVSAQTAGLKTFTLTLSPMNGPAVQLPVSINVGSAATSNNCSNSALWP